MSYATLRRDLKEWAEYPAPGIEPAIDAAIIEGQGFLEKSLVFNKVNHPAMRAVSTSIAVAPSSSSITLPTDYLATLHLNLIYGGQKYEVTESPSLASYANSSITGIPSLFVRSGDTLVFDITTDRAFTAELWYSKKLTALSDTNTTNWWDTNEYMTLLLCCLVELIPWLKDQTKGPIWKEARDVKIKNIVERWKEAA